MTNSPLSALAESKKEPKSGCIGKLVLAAIGLFIIAYIANGDKYKKSSSEDYLTKSLDGYDIRQSYNDQQRTIIEFEDNVSRGKFDLAIVNLRKIRRSLSDEKILQLISISERLTKSIPGSELEKNAEAYQFLSLLNPENSDYDAKTKLYRDRIIERNAERKRSALSVLRKKHDKIQNVTFYSHTSSPQHLNTRTSIYAYIGEKSGRYWVRLKIQYVAEDWLFIRNVIAYANGKSRVLYTGLFERDNDTRIWEWADISPSKDQLETLKILASANDATIRFEGSQYRRDISVSRSDKKAISDVILAYELLSK